ncbi:MAG: hypothetical protein M1838_005180 [Thelocarpon superellum]|nr:MAG: hypothetical protein M1838_005180 [Thelocarpon superellum]
MASKKDMRREDLVIPYLESAKKESEGDIASTLSSTLPMAAMFTRNKLIGWTSVVLAVQGWLAETPDQAKKSSQPAIFSIGMAVMALAVSYVQLFLPPPGVGRGGTGTEAPAPVPPS